MSILNSVVEICAHRRRLVPAIRHRRSDQDDCRDEAAFPDYAMPKKTDERKKQTRS